MKTLHRTKTLVLAGSLLLQLSTLCFHSRGAAGDVDLSFDPGSGVNGTVNTFVLQPDGKMIIAGEFTTVNGLARANLARLNADGSGDSSFHAGAGNPYRDYGYSVRSLALQADGKLLVGYFLGVDRLNADGSLDTNFVAAIDSLNDENGGYAVINAMALQPDGKLVIAGNLYTVNGPDTVLGVARLNANGSLDTNFLAQTDAMGNIYSVAVQPDGKILLGGEMSMPDGMPKGGVRLNVDGSLDSSFNPAPIISADSSSPAIHSLALQGDGKVLVGGYFSAIKGTPRNGVARFNADGTLDNTFVPGIGTNASVKSVTLQPDGKIIIGGVFSMGDGILRHAVARLTASGSLDAGFNAGLANFYITQAGAQPGAKVLVGGGFTTINQTNRNYLARLNADGGLDIGFRPGRGLSDPVSLLELQSDGKVVVNRDTRLNADGSVDSTYVYIPNTNSIPNIAVPGAHYTVAQCSAAQADGKVIIGGWTATILNVDEFNNHYFSFGWFVARVNADGSRDTNFNLAVGGNYGAWAVGSSPWNARDPWTPSVRVLEVQPDGKVLVGATFGVARLNANGAPDNSFTSGIGGSVYSMLLQPDGRVLVGSSAGVAWLNSNGIRDADFNPTINLSFFYPVAVVLQPDGRVLVGGSFSTVNGVSRKNIARLNSNGSLDTSFNTGTGSDAAVRAIALQPDGNVLIAGDFLTINGVVRPYVARLYGDSVAPLPSLNIARSNSFVIVSWPSSSTGFTLQQNTNGIATVNWSNVITTPTDNGTTKTVIVNPPTANRFFRLKSQ